MASWPPWANEAWDRQRRADGQGGSWVGGYISPNLGYISLNMDIYFNCEYISFNHGKSLKWEYISLHLIYSSRNFGYISLHAPLWDVSLISCISFLLPAKSIIHHICMEGWVGMGFWNYLEDPIVVELKLGLSWALNPPDISLLPHLHVFLPILCIYTPAQSECQWKDAAEVICGDCQTC